MKKPAKDKALPRVVRIGEFWKAVAGRMGMRCHGFNDEWDATLRGWGDDLHHISHPVLKGLLEGYPDLKEMHDALTTRIRR